MRILALETSCDETAAAIVENGTTVLSSVISSSMKSFERTGGVIPEDAARQQLAFISPVVHAVMDEAELTPNDIDAIAVTKGPGLSGSLLVGTTAARVLASVWQKPLVGVHHTLGHLSSPWLDQAEDIAFPVLCLSVSGGHTDLWYRTSHTEGTLLGKTRDDAAGEAFDKGAAMLGLPYPGGPSVQKAAEGGDTTSYPFPKPLHSSPGYDFSFSGLKTALKYTIRDLTGEPDANLIASYEAAICAHLVDRVQRAAAEHSDITEVHVVGGVSANARLREMMQAALDPVTVRTPVRIHYCTDNAAMIAAAAYFQADGTIATSEPFTVNASLSLNETLESGKHGE